MGWIPKVNTQLIGYVIPSFLGRAEKAKIVAHRIT
tara:strand:- start:1765 stop:1869 length:105 start_codon:yes stop_codon:yes gene_type:complete